MVTMSCGFKLHKKLALDIKVGPIFIWPFKLVVAYFAPFGLRSAIGGAFVYLQAFHCLGLYDHVFNKLAWLLARINRYLFVQSKVNLLHKL